MVLEQASGDSLVTTERAEVLFHGFVILMMLRDYLPYNRDILAQPVQLAPTNPSRLVCGHGRTVALEEPHFCS